MYIHLGIKILFHYLPGILFAWSQRWTMLWGPHVEVTEVPSNVLLLPTCDGGL